MKQKRPAFSSPGLSRSSRRELTRIVGREYVRFSQGERLCYAYDAACRDYLPDAVVFPENPDQIDRVMGLANQEGFFVVPRGAGTGMSGGAVAVRGGVVMPMVRLDRILRIDGENLVGEVEPGVVTGRFQREAAAKGLFYPPDPSSSDYCTMGGNVAECAGGPIAVKYGVTRDYVLGLEVVLAQGGLVHTGVQTAKGVVGYDLTRLLVGSEGTLGIITKITVRLLPLPQSVRTLTAVFDRIEAAAGTVAAIFRAGVVPRAVEYMDQAAISCAEAYLKIGLPVDAGAILLLELDGDPGQTERLARRLEQVCREQGAHRVHGASDPQEAAALWKARKSLSPALFRFGPDKINEDIVVPRNRIPELVRKIDALRKETGLTMVSFGHAGDGNIHFNIMLDKRKPGEWEKAQAAVEELFDHTLALGGTISGEHGVGITKAPYIGRELSQVELDLMKRIKAVFDPRGVLNPGKIFG